MSNRILLVEDDSTLSMIISETLQRNDFETVTARDGKKGWVFSHGMEPTS